jgi:hypothetical protein
MSDIIDWEQNQFAYHCAIAGLAHSHTRSPTLHAKTINSATSAINATQIFPPLTPPHLTDPSN